MARTICACGRGANRGSSECHACRLKRTNRLASLSEQLKPHQVMTVPNPPWWDAWITELSSRADRQQPLFDDDIPWQPIDLDRLTPADREALRAYCRGESLAWEVAA